MKKYFLCSFLLCMLSLNILAQVLNDSLVGYWPFNGNADDLSGNDNHGVVSGATLTTDRFGNSNSAYWFDGNENIIRVTHSNSLEITGQITISCWVKLESKSLPYLGRIVVKNPDIHNIVYGMFHGYTNYISMQLTQEGDLSTEYLQSEPQSINENEWEFVAITWDEDTMKIFINCQEIAFSPVSDFSSIATSNSDLTIGNGGSSYNSITGVKGSIDEVKIFKRALSSAELKEIFYNYTVTACNSYASPSGNYVWTSSGSYLDTIFTAEGCDSVITVDLTINTVDTSITQSGMTLTSNAIDATYQWLDCNLGYAPISNETNQSFTATANGDYAVEVTQDGCVDTSACHRVTTLGVLENDFGDLLSVYPNPTQGNITVELGQLYNNVTLKVINFTGMIISTNNFGTTSKLNIELEGLKGLIILEIYTMDGKKAIIKVIKD